MKMSFEFRVNDQLIFFITRKLGTQRDEIPKKVEPTGFFFLNFYNFVSHTFDIELSFEISLYV